MINEQHLENRANEFMRGLGLSPGDTFFIMLKKVYRIGYGDALSDIKKEINNNAGTVQSEV